MPENQEINGLSRRAFLQVSLAAAVEAAAQSAPAEPKNKTEKAPAADTRPFLYFIATAHNDTQWNWTVQATINDYIPKTVTRNEALFEQFPHYNFNYEGTIHYKFCKEYHPDLFAIIKKRVAEGRWKLAGSWINAVDTHIPSAESLFRQALYGQRFYRKEFGMVSRDVYLPDCFGFPAHLPTIAKHSGLIAFSTQKLTWGCFIPAPFAVGRWIGPDGSEVVASLRPGAYNTKVHTDPQVDPKWQNDFVDAGGKKIDLRYFGTGDTGGAPDAASAKWVNDAVADAKGPIRVLNTSSDQLAKDLTPAEIKALPTYKGELLLRLHAPGCYTSQAAMKKYNRRNEQLADAAERACVLSHLLGGVPYPKEHLRENWIRFLWHQFHDDVTGTCIPQAYTFSWNDELIALNGFASAQNTAIASIAAELNTDVPGIPFVVYNPLAFARQEVVEVEIPTPVAELPLVMQDMVSSKSTYGQVLPNDGKTLRVLFLVDAPSIGVKVFSADSTSIIATTQKVFTAMATGMENNYLKVTIDANGDVSSLINKENGQEALASPARIAFLDDVSPASPAWEIQYATDTAAPVAYLDKPTIKVIETGPVRVAVEIKREYMGSTWTQILRLTTESRSLEVVNRVDWKTPHTLAKAVFHTVATNPTATFDNDLGIIERGNAKPNLWEVPAHQWADVTDAGGKHGLAIMNDCKYGWDKPVDNILRHTLLHTPFAGKGRIYQGVQDVGHHEFIYALLPHSGDWRKAEVPLHAARLNQPLRAFTSSKHSGSKGAEFSLLKCDHPQVSIRAVKMAEDSDEIIVRVQEWTGDYATNATITFAPHIVSVREVNAAEEAVGAYKKNINSIQFDLAPYQPRTFAVQADVMIFQRARPFQKPLKLPFNRNGVTSDADCANGNMDELGRSIPAELWPAKWTAEAIEFELGSSAPDAKNMVVCAGQTVALPSGGNHLYLLACAVGGDTDTEFVIETKDGKRETTKMKVANWTSRFGQWYSTLEETGADGGKQVVRQTAAGTFEGLALLKPAFVKPDTIAWVGTHRHSKTGNEAHVLCYLFKYSIPLPANAARLILPNNDKIRVFAATIAQTRLEETKPAYVGPHLIA